VPTAIPNHRHCIARPQLRAPAVLPCIRDSLATAELFFERPTARYELSCHSDARFSLIHELPGFGFLSGPEQNNLHNAEAEQATTAATTATATATAVAVIGAYIVGISWLRSSARPFRDHKASSWDRPDSRTSRKLQAACRQNNRQHFEFHSPAKTMPKNPSLAAFRSSCSIIVYDPRCRAFVHEEGGPFQVPPT